MTMSTGSMEEQRGVRVSCRVRPALQVESTRCCTEITKDSRGAIVLQLNDPKGTQDSQIFKFDGLYTAASTQEDVFRYEVAHLVTGSLSGRSGSVFTYGVAGAGKTHSMFGKDDGMAKEVGRISDPSMNWGIAPRAIRMLLEAGDGASISASFFEMSTTRVKDLLNSKAEAEASITHCDGGKVEMRDISCVEIKSVEQFTKMVSEGVAARATDSASTPGGNNRSHAILSLVVRNIQGATGKLNLIDLAGSEDCKQGSGGAGQRGARTLAYSALSSLNKLIKSINDGSDETSSIYSASKLNTVLADSMGNSCLGSFLVCIAPHPKYYADTSNTLSFARSIQRVVQQPDMPPPHGNAEPSSTKSARPHGRKGTFANMVSSGQDLDAIPGGIIVEPATTAGAKPRKGAKRGQSDVCSQGKSASALPAKRPALAAGDSAKVAKKHKAKGQGRQQDKMQAQESNSSSALVCDVHLPSMQSVQDSNFAALSSMTPSKLVMTPSAKVFSTAAADLASPMNLLLDEHAATMSNSGHGIGMADSLCSLFVTPKQSGVKKRSALASRDESNESSKNLWSTQASIVSKAGTVVNSSRRSTDMCFSATKSATRSSQSESIFSPDADRDHHFDYSIMGADSSCVPSSIERCLVQTPWGKSFPYGASPGALCAAFPLSPPPSMPCFPNSLLDVGSNASFARSSSAESNRNGHSALLRILNNDSVDALQNLKGIGKERAKKVVEYRTSVKISGRDAFSNVSDLSQVGMNARSIARLVEENTSASAV